MSPDAKTTPSLNHRVDAFERLSREVSGAYRMLEQRAASLEDELARSRREKERQRLEKERLADRLSALIDSLPGAVFVLDEEDKVREANAQAEDWFGCRLRGQRWSALVAASSLRETGGGRELHGTDGTVFSVSRRLLAEAGERVVLVTDISEQRRLQQELEQHRKLATMGEMAARLAHQLRTPLSTAMLYASHLGSLALDRTRREAFAERLVGRLRELDRMTRDMLGFVRGPQTQDASLSLENLVEQLREALEGAMCAGRKLEVRSLPSGFAALRADGQALIPALSNVVENAWQSGAMHVELRFESAGQDAWRLRIRDDGPGIDPELVPRIFEPFFSARSGGTGLGLPVARSVAEAHGGSLALADPQPESGAEFEFLLPSVAGPRAIDPVPIQSCAEPVT